MSFNTVRRDIEKRLNDNWKITRIAFDNVEFTQPAENETWVKLRIMEDSVNRKNIGMPGVHRHSGTIIIEIFTPQGIGTKLMREHAADIAEIFRDVQFNGITCREARFVVAGEGDGWYKGRVAVQFFWDGVYS